MLKHLLDRNALIKIFSFYSIPLWKYGVKFYWTVYYKLFLTVLTDNDFKSVNIISFI